MTSSDLGRWRQRVDARLASLHATRARVRAEREAFEVVEARIAALGEATALAQAVAARVQTHAHARIAEIVTKCLAIFEEPYAFRIHFDRKRGRTEARLTFERDGVEVDPLSASGGGCVDVAAFALRVACLVLARPALRRVLVLDEPFRFVSPEYRGKVKKLLESLASDLGIQFVVVTHDNALRAGRVVRID